MTVPKKKTRLNAQGRERPPDIQCPYVLKMCVWPWCLGEYEPDAACVSLNKRDTK